MLLHRLDLASFLAALGYSAVFAMSPACAGRSTPPAVQSPSTPSPQQPPKAPVPSSRTISRSPLQSALPRREFLCAGGARVVVLLETNAARLMWKGKTFNMKKIEVEAGPEVKYAEGSTTWSSTGDDGFLIDNADGTHPKMLAEGCHLQSSYPPIASTAGSIKGRATFGSRLTTLPKDAVLIVQLRDLGKDADDPAAILAEERVPLGGRKSPVSFTLRYDSAKITSKAPAAISASITGRGKLLFVLVKSPTIPDLTSPGAGVVRLALSRATASSGQKPSVPEAPPHS